MQVDLNWFEKELTAVLRSEIDQGTVQIDPDWASVSERLCENFPFVGSGIDWDQVPGALIFPDLVEIDSKNSRELKEPAFALRKAWTEIQARADLDAEEMVTIFSDGHLNFALRMSLKIFSKYIVDILSLARNAYVVPTNYEWCVSYTSRGDLSFGKTPVRI